MKKICFFTGSMKQGGAERDISVLSNNLVEKGFDVYIVTVFNSDIFFTLSPKIKVIDISKKVNGRSLKSLSILKKNIKILQDEYKFDYVVCNMIGLNCVLVKTLRKADCKVVVRIVSDPKSWTLRNKLFSKHYYKKADIVIAQTNYQVACFGKKISKKAIVIPNIVQSNLSIVADDNYKKKELVYIGRLNAKVKRIDLLIEGFKKFVSSYPDFKLKLIGNFSDEESERLITGCISQNKLNDSIVIVHGTEDVFSSLKESFCYVFSSPHEGMPNSVLEAAISGLPVVCSNFAGVDEIINNMSNGLIYEFGNIDDFLAKLLLLVNDFELYKKLSINGLAEKEKYSCQKVLGKWLDVFRG